LNEEDKEEKKINIRRAYSTSITSSLTVFSMFFFQTKGTQKKEECVIFNEHEFCIWRKNRDENDDDDDS